ARRDHERTARRRPLTPHSRRPARGTVQFSDPSTDRGGAMPISLSCPCGARLNAPDTTAGKKVKCPKCGDPIAVPAAAGFEVVDEKPVPAARPRRRVEDDEDDDRPARSRRRDDDEDDRPRKKKRKAKSGGVPVWAWATGGGLLLVAGVVVAVLALGGKK